MRNSQPQSISVATCSTIIRFEGWYGGHLKLHILEQNLYSWRDFLSFDPCTVCISIAIRSINNLKCLVCTLHTLKFNRMKETGFTEEAGKIAWPMQLILIISLEQSKTFAKMSHVENLIPNLKSSDQVSNALEMHTCQRIQKLISRNTPPVITDSEMMREKAIMTIVVVPQFRSPWEVDTLFWWAAGSLESPARLRSAQTPGLSSDWSSCCIETLRDEQ